MVVVVEMVKVEESAATTILIQIVLVANGMVVTIIEVVDGTAVEDVAERVEAGVVVVIVMEEDGKSHKKCISNYATNAEGKLPANREFRVLRFNCNICGKAL